MDNSKDIKKPSASSASMRQESEGMASVPPPSRSVDGNQTHALDQQLDAKMRTKKEKRPAKKQKDLLEEEMGKKIEEKNATVAAVSSTDTQREDLLEKKIKAKTEKNRQESTTNYTVPASRSSMAAAKKDAKLEATSLVSTTTSIASLQQTSVKEEDHMVEYPGAVAVRGIDSNPSSNQSIRYDLGSSSANDSESLINDSGMQEAVVKQEPEENLINAFLVDEDTERNQVPYAEATAVPETNEDEPHRRRRRDIIIVVGVVLFVGIIVAIVVPLTIGNKDSSDDIGSISSISMEPTTTAPPSKTPPTMAPTQSVDVTVALRLDQNPQETGWSIVCGVVSNRTIISVPPGTYERENRTFAVTVPVGSGEICTFQIVDTASNGISDGTYRLNYGPDFTDAASSIAEGTTNFTNIFELSFPVMVPPTPSPTTTVAPTTTMAPSDNDVRSTVVPITVIIQLDDFPLETGFSITCSDGPSFLFPEESFAESFQVLVERFAVLPDSECTLVVTDSFGDGICCEFGPGFVRVYFGEVELPLPSDGIVLAEVTEFASRAEVTFTVSLPEPTVSPAPTTTTSPTVTSAPTVTTCPPDFSLVSVVVHTDDRPGDTSWDLVFVDEQDLDQVLSQGGPYASEDQYMRFEERTCGPPGACLIFTIRDFRGFGLFLPGFYSVSLDDQEIASGGDYLGFEESVRFGDNCAPTLAPTTTDNDCPDGFVPLLIQLRTDLFPEQTSWDVLYNINGIELQLLQGGPYEPDQQSTIMKEESCVSPDGCLTFTIQDTGGDGIRNFPNGLGSYTIFLNDNEVTSGGGFGSVDVARFGNCAPTNAPTFVPPTSTCDAGFSLFHLVLTTNLHPDEISWDLVDGSGQVLLAESTYDQTFTTFTSEVCVDNAGCTTFTIYDSFGDGICCFYGSGGYTLFLDGEEFATGGDFRGPSESVRFGTCVPLEESPVPPVLCPTDGFLPLHVEIVTDLNPSQTTWDVVESGSVILQGGPYSSSLATNLDVVCVNPDACVTFEIRDSFGDGIANYLTGFGRYAVYLDGEEVGSGGNFGFSEIVQVGNCAN